MRLKDLDGIMRMYAADAVFVQPDKHEIVGRDAVRALYQQVFAAYDSYLTLHFVKWIFPDRKGAVSFRPADSITDTGTYTETLRDRRTSKFIHTNGQYRFTYRLGDDGVWLCTRMEWTGPTLH